MSPLPSTQTIAVLGLSSPFLLYFFRACFSNYNRWLALPPGGLPPNILGWAIQWALHLTVAKRDMTSTGCYDEPWRNGEIPENEAGFHRRTFLGGGGEEEEKGLLPQRDGAPGVIAPFCLPQRQGRESEEVSPMEIRKLAISRFNALKQEYGSLIEMRASALELKVPAYFVTASIPVMASAGKTHREITHVHDTEGSSHVSLSYRDAKEVMEKGWGQRHPLGGAVGLLPKCYIFVYAPRTKEELEVNMTIWRASIEFMTCRRKVLGS